MDAILRELEEIDSHEFEKDAHQVMGEIQAKDS